MNKKFNIQCEMPERWIPHFLGMLNKMEYLGKIGASRKITIYSDGDGDFHPKFTWDISSDLANPLKQEKVGMSPLDDGYTFDAG